MISFEFDDTEAWATDGLEQMLRRKKKGKPERDGVQVNDRSLVKKLQERKECVKVELIRLQCHVAFETTMFGVRAIYRSSLSDGTVRETEGKTHYLSQGVFSFKTDSERTKLTVKRELNTIVVQDQNGKLAKVSPSLKVGLLRKQRTASAPAFVPKQGAYFGKQLMLRHDPCGRRHSSMSIAC